MPRTTGSWWVVDSEVDRFLKREAWIEKWPNKVVFLVCLCYSLAFLALDRTDAVSGASRLCSLMLSCVLVRFRFTRVELASGEKGIRQTSTSHEKNCSFSQTVLSCNG